jgi:hypothetical protein
VRSKRSTARTRSARVTKAMRHKRVQLSKAFTRLPMAVRAGVTAILVIGFGAMAMLILGAQHSADTSARVDMPSAPSSPKAAVKAAPAPTSLPRIPDIVPAVNTAPEESLEKTAVKQAAVTLTGCLERDDDAFRLKDTDGDAAPKARSWKTGFLKKSSASVAVVDTSQKLKLPALVGQRVSVTGTLVNREMQVRSLTKVAPSCDGSTKVKI